KEGNSPRPMILEGESFSLKSPGKGQGSRCTCCHSSRGARSPPEEGSLMASVSGTTGNLISRLGARAAALVEVLGEVTVFPGRPLGWMLRRRPAPGTLTPSFYSVGFRSMPVVAVTGTFLGMVLAVQSVSQFQQIGMGTRVGGIINMSV